MTTLPACYRCRSQPCECKDGVSLYLGDCREILPALEGVTAVVTDPPYGLEFMGKEWDKLTPTQGRADLKTRENFKPIKSTFKAGVGTKTGFPKKNPRCRLCGRLKFDHPKSKCNCKHSNFNTRQSEYAYLMQCWHEEWAEALLQCCLPGAPLLSFGGTRTYHRLVCAIEDAGWEIRDCLMWVFSQGFPKSLDVSKAIDKAAGAERETVGVCTNGSGPHNIKLDNHGKGDTGIGYMDGSGKVYDVTAPATEAAKTWDGWGTSLKPSYEPICLAQKPLDGTYAANALEHGVAGLNVDGTRIATAETCARKRAAVQDTAAPFGKGYEMGGDGHPSGRWPANLIHDGSDEVVAMFPETASSQPRITKRSPDSETKGRTGYGVFGGQAEVEIGFGDSGSAARFFYCCKASASDRGHLPAEELPLFGIKHDKGLDGSEVIIIGVAWENQVHQVRLRVVTDQSRPKVIAVFGAHERNPTVWNRLLFGSNGTAPYLKGSRYTTETATNSTTTSATWNFLTHELTRGSMEDVLNGTGLSSSPAESAGELILLTSITSGRMASLLGVAPAASRTLLQISASEGNCSERRAGKSVNFHATVKPLALMEYLVKLVTMPERNLILDPFAGSGTTGVAAKRLGLPCVLVESEVEYCEIAKQRLESEPTPLNGKKGAVPCEVC